MASTPETTKTAGTDMDVRLMQHTYEMTFPDARSKSTLRVITKALQTLDKAGIQKTPYFEIEANQKNESGETVKIARTLSPDDHARYLAATNRLEGAVHSYRPPFVRPLAEYSISVFSDVELGATKRADEVWSYFVELSNDGESVRCVVGDLRKLYEFVSALEEAAEHC